MAPPAIERRVSTGAKGQSSGYIRVGVRCRPLGEGRGERGKLQIDPQNGTITAPDTKPFMFEDIYEGDVDNGVLFERVGRPLVESVFGGYNATLFAYGQTGAGKTYTIGEMSLLGGPHEGVAHRMVRALYENPPADLGATPTAWSVRYVQVYVEKVYDLLAPPSENPQSLPLREDKQMGVYVAGATTLPAPTADECLAILKRGSGNLSFAATKMNRHSSRSHAVCRIFVECEVDRSSEGASGGGGGRGHGDDGGGAPLAGDKAGVAAWRQETVNALSKDIQRAAVSRGQSKAVLTLCDLAGSEDVGRSGATGQALSEAKKINTSLLALGNVINALTEADGSGRASHVPFRDSVLTRILQTSIGGNCKTSLVTCVSPADGDLTETLSTLRFAARAKKVRNVARANVTIDASQLSEQASALAETLQTRLASAEEELTAARERCEHRTASTLAFALKLNRATRKAATVSEENAKASANVAQVEAQFAKKEESLRAAIEEAKAAHESKMREAERAHTDEVTSLQGKLRAAGAAAARAAGTAEEETRAKEAAVAEVAAQSAALVEEVGHLKTRHAAVLNEQMTVASEREATLRREHIETMRAEVEAAVKRAEDTAEKQRGMVRRDAEAAARAAREAAAAELTAAVESTRSHVTTEMSTRHQKNVAVQLESAKVEAAAATAAELERVRSEATLTLAQREATWRKELDAISEPLRQELRTARDDAQRARDAAAAASNELKDARASAERMQHEAVRTKAAEQALTDGAIAEAHADAAKRIHEIERLASDERSAMQRAHQDAAKVAAESASALRGELDAARRTQERMQALVSSLRAELDELHARNAKDEHDKAEKAARSAMLREAVIDAATRKAEENADAAAAAAARATQLEQYVKAVETKLYEGERARSELSRSLECEKAEKVETLSALQRLGSPRPSPQLVARNAAIHNAAWAALDTSGSLQASMREHAERLSESPNQSPNRLVAEPSPPVDDPFVRMMRASLADADSATGTIDVSDRTGGGSPTVPAPLSRLGSPTLPVVPVSHLVHDHLGQLQVTSPFSSASPAGMPVSSSSFPSVTHATTPPMPMPPPSYQSVAHSPTLPSPAFPSATQFPRSPFGANRAAWEMHATSLGLQTGESEFDRAVAVYKNAMEHISKSSNTPRSM